MCGELWVGAETPAWNHPDGRILLAAWNKNVPPQSSGELPFHISGHAGVVDFGGTGVSGLESPRGQSLRSAWNKNVPPQSSGELPSHASEKSMRHSSEMAGVSALESPKSPETPLQMDE